LAAIASRLTDDEGTFLALLVRVQPATAYQLSKIYADSPVSNIGTSKGKIYPMVERLQNRGLLKKRPVKGDARGSESLECTARGETAVRAWVLDIKPNHILLEDPLRTKLQSFDLLSRDEQLEWIVEAKSELQNKLDELEAYAAEVTVPYKELVHDNAVSSVRSRMDWLDRVLAAIVRSKESKNHAA
jgi:DNA-binding PadR family transcriptional regulator